MKVLDYYYRRFWIWIWIYSSQSPSEDITSCVGSQVSNPQEMAGLKTVCTYLQVILEGLVQEPLERFQGISGNCGSV